MVADAVREFTDECYYLKRNAIALSALNGEQVKVSRKEDVDSIVEQLHGIKGHNGVVIAGCDPWWISIVRIR